MGYHNRLSELSLIIKQIAVTFLCFNDSLYIHVYTFGIFRLMSKSNEKAKFKITTMHFLYRRNYSVHDALFLIYNR